MKIFYLALLFASISFTTHAQLKTQHKLPKKSSSLSSFLSAKKTLQHKFEGSNLRTAATCSYDTVEYVYAKATGINFLPIVNSTGNLLSLGQYFDCPQPVTISGFYFVAIKPDSADATPVNVTCSVYNATADSTIFVKLGTSLEAPLASVIVPVDTLGYSSDVFNGLRKAVFAKPITVNKPYILSITNSSTVDPIFLVTSDYDDTTSAGKPRYPDGYEEWLLSMVVRNSATSISAYRSDMYWLDADLLLTPFVKYDVTANFSVSDTIVSVGQNLVITNLSSPIARSAMYNTALLSLSDSLSHFWTFGDSTDGVANVSYNDAKSFTKKYSAPGTYTITLNDSIYGFYRYCGDQKSIKITVVGTQDVTKEYNSKNIRLFPNPNEGEFTLSFDQLSQTAYSMTISDLAGAEILHSQTSGKAEEKFSLKNYPKGMYLLKLVNDKEQIIKQVIVR